MPKRGVLCSLMPCLFRVGLREMASLIPTPNRVFLKRGGGAVRGDPPPQGDPELLEAPKAPNKFFGLN